MWWVELLEWWTWFDPDWITPIIERVPVPDWYIVRS